MVNRVVITILMLGIAASALMLMSCRDHKSSSASTDCQKLLRQSIGVSLPPGARSIKTYTESLMAYHFWAEFEIPENSLSALISDDNRLPRGPLKESKDIAAEMMSACPDEVKPWWNFEPSEGRSNERRGVTPSKVDYWSRISVVDLDGGYCRVFVLYSED